MSIHQTILDPTFNKTEWRPARGRRMALVAFLDLLILSVPWAFSAVALRHYVPDVSISPGLALLGFAAIEVALLRFFAWSPGCAILRVRLVEVRELVRAADQIWYGHLPYVAREQKERESWFTLALATWILNDASKSLVRWSMWMPPAPFFGFATNEVTGAIMGVVSGAFEATIAVALFRASVRAVLIGVPYYTAQLASAAISWDLWAGWAGEMVVRRRAYQGVPVRVGEIERTQATAAFVMVGGLVVLVILLLLALPRLRDRRQREGDINALQ